jgi:hypothetical protein
VGPTADLETEKRREEKRREEKVKYLEYNTVSNVVQHVA